MVSEEWTSEALRIALQKMRDPAAPASPDILEALQFARLETIDALMTFDLVEFDKLKRPTFAPLKALREITRDLRGLTHEDDRTISLIIESIELRRGMTDPNSQEWDEVLEAFWSRHVPPEVQNVIEWLEMKMREMFPNVDNKY
jgi:hypothetical protein